ncbi:MAG: sulfite exporter TauE/SafE family protein, partial [Actinomycetia bacterium]|nr:sulfite exporter TauE/SafE family protein [Actinomycetes bacterium]
MTPIAIGLIAGLISGSFGVGGGIIIVPGLVLLLKFSQRLSHGTSLLAILPIAVSGVIGFALHGSINLSYALLLGIGSMAGAILGTKLLAVFDNTWLSRVF